MKLQTGTRWRGRRMQIAPALTGVLLFLALAGCQPDKDAAGKPAAGGGQPPKVDVKTLRTQQIELKETSSGRVSAFREAEVRPQVSGIIQKRLFVEGGVVKQGDLLYQVDPAPYQAALESAQASLAVAEANVDSTRNKAERYQSLASQAAVSKQDRDDAAAAWKQAEAQVKVAKAAIRGAQINLGYTRITAPINGVTGRSSVTEGALVAAQQAASLVTIRQLSPVYVDVQRNALAVAKSTEPERDQNVTLTLEDGTPFPETGTLKFNSASVDESTGTLNARAVFENKEGLLLPGMFVRATLVTGVIQDGLLAPQQGITRIPNGGASALVVNADNKVESRDVAVSQTIGDQWLVSSGLAAGDRVIYSGLQKIKPGALVQPLEDGKPADAGKPAPTPQQKQE
ncbi:efflux RND transporter periplasmic adaptor subunit [Candidatus Thiothrix sp. Deng01]|uniref:Efflux RND transporter periplasmic adaptor subunit n=1 Tax=Candidatus Thiothrix phosphatis TaxID=3112415 RepID=A0ABU6D1M2_9GAMM|nr:efflux RND transporter periplasmic adaptor subunit [Candidatus Thiothrix sp. Deng01]MEB4592959.1 efflux RND transporter periplasmic adaptor subunit [Candidatus Thiothrix sp. Deng01]